MTLAELHGFVLSLDIRSVNELSTNRPQLPDLETISRTLQNSVSRIALILSYKFM